MFVPVSSNKPLPVFVSPAVPLPLLITPEITAQSAVEAGLSSTCTVRVAALRLILFCSVTTLAAESEPNFSVPAMFVAPVPQVTLAVPLLILTFIGAAPAANPPPVVLLK